MNRRDPTVQRVLDDPGFAALKRFSIETTGLSYYEDKDDDLAMAVVRALDEAPFDSARARLAALSESGSPALDRLVEELTIGETFFFRHTEMFDALRQHVFPDIHARKGGERRMRIWSAGCSVGAEPYSLSILLREDLAPLFHDWSIEIIGTDINRRFLAIAREAAYENWALRGMPEAMQRRCFERQDRKWRLKHRFTRDVVFWHHNLVRDRFPSLSNHLFALDLVICRNVMIYFNQATVRQLAEQFHQCLLPGGWLALGHSEPHTETFRAFRTVNTPGAVLYRRATAGQPADAMPGEWFTKAKAPPPSPPAWVPPFFSPPPRETLPAAPASEAGGACAVAQECVGLDSVRRMADAGDLGAALLCCDQLAEREKLNPAMHFYHGLILEQAGAVETAHKALRRSIYLNRNFLLAHYHLGLLQQKLGRRAQAVRSFRNTELLLGGQRDDSPIPFGDGLLAGDLRSLIAMKIANSQTEPAS